MNTSKSFPEVSVNAIVRKIQTISCVKIETLWDFLGEAEAMEIWTKLDGWEDIDDLEIYERMTQYVKPAGLLYVVTNGTYRKNCGGTEIESVSLDGYIK